MLIFDPQEMTRGTDNKKPKAGGEGSWRYMGSFAGFLCPLFSMKNLHYECREDLRRPVDMKPNLRRNKSQAEEMGMRLCLVSRKGIGQMRAGGEIAMQVNIPMEFFFKIAISLHSEKIPVLGNKRPASNPIYAIETL